MANDPNSKGAKAARRSDSAQAGDDAAMEQALFEAMTRNSKSASREGTVPDSARDHTMSEPLASHEVPETPAAPANDDRPSVGRVLREVQGRLPRTSYVVATVFAFGWAACGIILARLYFSDLQALAGIGPAATPALIGLAAVLFVPILFFYFLAHMMWRAQELRVIAQSMATMAMRFSEPETTARDALTTIGQAIRRDVSVMSDSVERALSRAAELQTLLDKEVAALERASNTSESRIRVLLDDLTHHRENLVGQTELLREVVNSGVSSSDKAVNAMRNTVELFDSRVNAKTDEVTTSLDQRLERFREALDQGTQSLETTLNARVLEIARTLSDSGKDVVASLERRAEDARGMIASQGGDFIETLGAKLAEIENKIGERAQGLVADLDGRVGNFEQIAIERSKAAAEAIASHSMGAVDALNAHLEHLSQSLKTNTGEAREAIDQNTRSTAELLTTRMGELSQSIRTAAGEATEGVAAHANAAAGTLQARADELSRLLQTTSAEATEKLVSDTNAATERLVSDTNAATEKLVSHTNAATESLGARVENLTQTIDRQTTDAEQTLARFSGEVEQKLTKLSTGIATVLKQNAGEIETTMLGVSAEVVRNFVGKADEMSAALSERAEQMAEILDEKSGRLIATLGEKGNTLSGDVERITGEAVKAIEDQGIAFLQNVKESSDNIARLINETSGIAAEALSKSIEDLQERAASAIEASRKSATASLTEIRESHDMLRADSTNVFERLREANVLLQEVLSGAHDSMGTLETTLSTRLSEFVGAMTEVTERSGAATDRMTGHIAAFQGATSKVLGDLTNLADQVESHGNVLVQAVDLIDKINQRTVDAVNERRAALDQLIGSLDQKTDDLEQRLRRFAGLLDSSLEGANNRAREIGRMIAETSAEGARTISEQFEVVRDTTEKERRLTIETMQGVYEQAMGDTHTLFRQTTERFSDLLRGVKDMSAEMQRELDATRTELRRGVLELPQETAESAAQMRRVIVDQIEALAELNRFVARHARGQQQEARAAEPALSVVGGGREPAPRPAPPARVSERAEAAVGPQRPARPAPAAPPPGQGANRSGWLSDLLQRTSRPAEHGEDRGAAPEGRAAHSIDSLDALSADISRMVDHEAVAELWDRYNRGERNVFSRRLYTPHGLAAFDEIRKRYRVEGQFRQTIDHYIAEFERLLNEVSRGDRGQIVVRTYLTSETGKVYTLLAHAAGRFD